ncbi:MULTISPECIES: 16S rRNA (cytosine(1402)-N(4))-methyltransferase RsmH [unclassified Roseateles]|uniref:16S rRNA (cytosine(1402)-N(4))-methyltransferase RsmH n=1 Tax=unclassified Roseateles TaxID=2626991 RepID=UPI0006F3DF71|nr:MULTISPECIES: 16S rRNA (cytosine(1402)-N(4))-methyltransferase RsmH [unclassified Roseateles]KQW51569.1 ribosomal RNA small subunit methyltransferase H [Pelomonas sp. Root405]KRA77802.1 ribosomal RNA small subunit methyltransferase H [Pelomonas sp. Root662]
MGADVNPSAEFRHTTVLLNEAVDGVLARPDGVYVDGTFGRGGHSRALLAKLAPQGRLIGIDRDPEAVAAAAAIQDPRFSICHSAFADMADQLAGMGVHQVDGVLLDLGVSSPQIDNPERGFSFRFSGPLDMRMDTTRGISAADFLARADEREIARVIKDYGEERFASQIAKAVVARREAGTPLTRTDELRELVARTVKTREPGQDPATRTFQALRIHVNGELEELEQGLSAALRLLAPGGRLSIISFHSLEDRRVKQFIAEHSKAVFDRRAPFAPAAPLILNALDRIKPSDAEVAANPRARSAVLRIAERTDAPLPPVTSRR